MAAKGKAKKVKKRIQIPEEYLSAAAAFSFLLGHFRWVRLVNDFGDLGSACFYVAADLSLFLFALWGLGQFHAVSSMVLSRIERESVQEARRVVTTALFSAIGINLALCFAGYVLSAALAELFNVPLAAMAFKAMLLALVPLSVCSVLAGAMDGFGNPKGLYAWWISGCLVLFFAGPAVSAPLTEYGKKVGALLQNDSYSAAYGAQGAAISVFAASVVAMAVCIVAWQLMKRELWYGRFTGNSDRRKQLIKRSFFQSLPVMLPALFIAIAVLGQGIVFAHSKAAPRLEDTVLDYGVFVGKSRILILFPILVALAFSVRMLPSLQVGYASRNLKKSRDKCMICLRCCAFLMMPFTIAFAVLAKPLVTAFFSEGEIELAVSMVRAGSICVIFFGLACVLGIILFSMDMLQSIVVDMAACVAVHFVVLIGLLAIPDLGIYALVYANLVLSFLLCLSFWFSIRRQMKLRISWLRIFLAPLIGGAVMAAICAMFGFVLLKNAPSAVCAAVSGLIGAALYIVTVIALKGITARELKAFPGGGKIIAFARLLRLM